MDFQSEYFYPKAPSIAAKKVPAISSAHAVKLRDVCDLLPLDNRINAYLLAGWLVCAQVSGVLAWRPHVWITGRKGSGKSWAMENIIQPIMGKNSLQVQSCTTEAGVRQSLQGDARAVVFDEIESEEKAARANVQKILQLARMSSSEGGGIIAKGTPDGKPMAFTIRSCFCFSSIMSGAVQSSDKSRITEIEVDAKRYGSAEKFEALKALVTEVITPDWCAGFYWRCVENAATIRDNAKVFSKAAGDFFGDRRMGDQIGTLLAGAFSLTVTGTLTHERAMEWLKDRNEEGAWQDKREEAEAQSDEAKLFATIMQAHIMHDGRQSIMGELVNACAAGDGEHTETRRATLHSYGMKVENGSVIIANNCENMRKLLRDTPFSDNWGKMLQRLPNAVKSDGVARFGSGVVSRATVIPLDL
jgi:putative DNA primase/helicase